MMVEFRDFVLTGFAGPTTAEDPQAGADEPVPVVADNQVNDPPQELDDSEATMEKDDKEAISSDNIISDESEVGTRDKKTGSYAEPGDEDEFTATT